MKRTIGLFWGNRRWIARISGWPTATAELSGDALTLRARPFGPTLTFERADIDELVVKPRPVGNIIVVRHHRRDRPRYVRFWAPGRDLGAEASELGYDVTRG